MNENIDYRFEKGLHRFRTIDRSVDYACVAENFDEALAMFRSRYLVRDVTRVIDHGFDSELKMVRDLIKLANKHIKEGRSVSLFSDYKHRLVLQVFRGSQWTGGEWVKVSQTEEATFFGAIASRKYQCNRLFVLNDDWNIVLTPCEGECIAEVKPGVFVDYTTRCELRG